MFKKLLTVALLSLLFTGCASVTMESSELSEQAKQFNPPADGKAGLYIYRSGVFGAALKKDLWVDGKCIGESAPNTFFYEEVNGDEMHKVSTESEFSPNDLNIQTDSGKNYFVRQFIKMGLFVGGAGVEQVSLEKGQKAIGKLEMAKKGNCSQ
ncbi:MAG: DUF2846 domain-containing protein [Oceanospirillaceae bacterium]|nr:DUF2846 domain-containing protein [Oceanospirillaceae bacterium]